MSSKPKVDLILCHAAEIASEAERRQYLETACDGDAELLARVEKLLVAHIQAGDFMREEEVERTRDLSPPSRCPGERIGPYKLRERIGEGAWGSSGRQSRNSRYDGRWH